MVVGDFAIELDTVVVGSGPGGYVAAIRAAQLGQKVAIVERDFIGGVCLNVGCIPTKALISAGHKYSDALDSKTFGINTENVELDFTKTQKWKDTQVVNRLTKGVEGLLKKNNVEIIRGEAYFNNENTLRVMNEDSAQTYSFNHAIVATGSHPLEVPGIPFSDRVLNTSDGLNVKQVPEELIIIGSGFTGTQFAGAFANLGANVTLIEQREQILYLFEKDMTKLVEKEYKRKKKINIITEALAKEANETENGVEISYEQNGETKTVSADYVIVAAGRVPNTEELGLEAAGVEINDEGHVKVDNQGRTSVENIFAIGDIVPGLNLAHKASYEGKTAAGAISGKKVENDYRALPAPVITDPELAMVGLSEEEAKNEGLNVKVTKFPLSGNGRALSMNATDGFVRLVTTVEDDVIVGAQVAGASASDLIGELGLAIESGMNAEDIALTIHAHPTLAESIMDTAEAALGLPIHM